MIRKLLPALCAAAVLLPLVSPAAAAPAEDGRPFRDVSAASLPDRGDSHGTREMPLPRRYRALEVDLQELENLLNQAPAERSEGAVAETPPLRLALPYPDGRDRLFYVEESSILEPGLAAQFPEIRTFVVKGIDDPTATGRLSLTSLGFHAMVLSARTGTVFIDPYRRWDKQYVLSYFKADARKAAGKPFHCEVEEAEDAAEAAMESPAVAPVTVASGTQLRTYRLAMAATGEYSAAVCAPNPANVTCAMNAIAVSVNRVDGVYERDLAVRVVLIANNNLIVFTDGGTDPYDNEDGGTMLNQNQTTINMIIGSANYDVGHVFSTGGGGIAQLRVPCTANKAKGVTGLDNPVGDGFDIDYVAHEMGHQFGGDHTFNGTTGACGGNRSTSSAYEPGSGSTIMAYAGICGGEDLQPHSDDTFHPRSFDQIVAFTTGTTGNSCAVVTATGNTPPVVEAGAAYTIPKQTPFTLTGSAVDADPGDTAALTYMWEEMDLGSSTNATTILTGDLTAVRPIFRSFVPLTVPSRTFPRLSDILNNTATIGESMSTRDRTMTFRLTARDNRTGGGGVDFDSTTVTISAAAGPFAVTQPNTAVTWTGNSPQTVTWNVAGTTAAPVSCANVAIGLSTDGGLTFPTVIAAATPNDGSEVVLLPDAPTDHARVRVSCLGNIFFDISNADFTITPGAAPVETDFYTVAPCRVVDTRDPVGPTGGPALADEVTRNFPVAEHCGVPAGAKAVAVNVTVISPTASGNLAVFPGGITPPTVSTINFVAGQNRANNALVALGGDGSVDVRANLSTAGTTHFTLDVVGYFQ